MLFALHLLRQQLKQFFEMVIEVLLNSVYHPLVIVLNNAFSDILTL